MRYRAGAPVVSPAPVPHACTHAEPRTWPLLRPPLTPTLMVERMGMLWGSSSVGSSWGAQGRASGVGRARECEWRAAGGASAEVLLGWLGGFRWGMMERASWEANASCEASKAVHLTSLAEASGRPPTSQVRLGKKRTVPVISCGGGSGQAHYRLGLTQVDFGARHHVYMRRARAARGGAAAPLCEQDCAPGTPAEAPRRRAARAPATHQQLPVAGQLLDGDQRRLKVQAAGKLGQVGCRAQEAWQVAVATWVWVYVRARAVGRAGAWLPANLDR